MQTFLPYGPHFGLCASALDDKRLGKQRAENIQIIRALLQPGYGWSNHPAVKMWEGNEYLLLDYHRAVVGEWLDRGHEDNGTVQTFTDTLYKYKPPKAGQGSPYIPLWLEDPRLSASHRASLYRKDPEFYAEFADATLDSCHPMPYTVLNSKGHRIKHDACTTFWPTHTPEYGR